MKRRLISFIPALLATFLCGACQRKGVEGAKPRLVTFSPALTDLVFDMGLGDHVVAVTSQCQLPPGQQRRIVGDAFTVNTEAILSVQPDALLIQMDPRQFEVVRKIKPDVGIEHFTIEKIDDVTAAVERIGRIVGKEEVGKLAAERFRGELDAVRRRVADRPRPRVLFVMGYKEPSTAGGGTFVGEMIEIAGGRNAAAESYDGWKSLNLEYILSARPDVLVCWTAPNEANEAREYWSGLGDLPAVRERRVLVVTERDWTIPTTRLAGYVSRLADLIHPETTPGGAPR